jgi:endo-1,4-beta-mannosidase
VVGTSRYLVLHGRPRFLLGVNYWSQIGGPRMWDQFDPVAVEREIVTMRAIGLEVCRAFVFIPSFMPAPPAVEVGAVARFRAFLDLAARHGLAVLPSLLVGHMSGENFDFPGQGDRSLYQDPELLAWQRTLVDAVCGAVRGHPAVIGWVLSNEMPLWGGRAAAAVIRPWAETLIAAVRQADPGRPVGIGDGYMDQHGGHNGYDAGLAAEVADWLGPHTYYSDIDPLRHSVQTEVLVRRLERRGRPVLLEEFGCSSTQASPESQAAYFRESIHGVFSLGGAGALGWCYGDLRLAHQAPYRHHGFELGFGIVDGDGQEKPVARELRAMAGLLEAVDVADLRFAPPRVAIVVPGYFHTDFPFSSEDRRRMRLVLIQSYALALSAGMEADLIDEDEPLAPYQLVVVPSTQKLLEPTWEAIVARVEQGATAYVSFLYSDNAFHQGMWWSGFQAATGLVHELRYGLPDPPDPRVTLRLPGGAVSTRPPSGSPWPAARLPVRVADAHVVARDQRGQPALTVKRHGRGQLFFLTYPWEYYLGQQAPSLDGDRSHRLYALVRQAAGLPPPPVSGPPTVHARHVGRVKGGALLWVFNRAHTAAAARIRLPRTARLLLGASLPVGSAGVARLRLAPKEVQVWDLPA